MEKDEGEFHMISTIFEILFLPIRLLFSFFGLIFSLIGGAFGIIGSIIGFFATLTSALLLFLLIYILWRLFRRNR